MKAVLQRVSEASVIVNEEIITSIGRGVCALIGIKADDTNSDVEYMVRKVLNTRIFEGSDGKRWQKSVKDSGLEVLCISQPSLYYKMEENKPLYENTMNEDSNKLYTKFINEVRRQYKPELVKEGLLDAVLQINIVNDGPVTIPLESPVKSKPQNR